MLGACAERAAVRLLADERDRARPELEGDAPQVVFGAGEVDAAEVARPWCRAGGCVRDADAELEQLELLSWLEQPRREPGVVEQSPEVVARVREVGVGGGRHAAGIDATEDDVQAGAEHVRDGAGSWRNFGTMAFPTRHDFLVTIAVGRRLGLPG